MLSILCVMTGYTRWLPEGPGHFKSLKTLIEESVNIDKGDPPS